MRWYINFRAIKISTTKKEKLKKCVSVCFYLQPCIWTKKNLPNGKNVCFLSVDAEEMWGKPGTTTWSSS